MSEQRYRDLFLFASVTRATAKPGPDLANAATAESRLRVRLSVVPPGPSAWRKLSHSEEEGVQEWVLADDMALPNVLQPTNAGGLEFTKVAPYVERCWAMMKDWLLSAVLKLTVQRQLDILPIRLNIVTATPSLWLAPWEWMTLLMQFHIPMWHVTLNRAVPAHLTPPRLSVRGNLRLLVIPSNPKDERQMNVLREMELLETGPKIDRKNAASGTQEVLTSQMASFQPHIVHYVGHAGVDGCEGNLILENERGTTVWIDGETLQQNLLPSVRLICLATCVTAKNYDIRGFAHFALNDSGHRPSNLPSIVYTQFPVSEEVSRAFWRTFYEELVETNSDLSAAVDAARKAARDASPTTMDWSSFVLVLRDQFGSNAGRPFQLVPQEVPPPPIGIRTDTPTPTPQKESSEEMESYFASQLANQLEALSANLHPDSETSMQIADQLRSIKKFIY